MSKARDLADSVSTGGILEDGAVSVSEISDLTATATELNYVDGVTSAVQTQIDAKAPTASPVFTGNATFDTDTLAVDSTNNRVGIGTTSPSVPLDIQANGSGNALTLRGRNAAENAGWLAWTNYAGTVQAGMYATLDNLIFANGSGFTERMRIDSSGNLLVGTTVTNPSGNNDASGIELSSSGQVNVSQSGANALDINRGTSDGDLAVFRKDGTTVGNIGVTSGDIYIDGSANHSGIRLQAGSLMPRFNGSDSNGTVDLGYDDTVNAYRFKDLYLSGGVVETTTTVTYASSIALTYDNGSIQTVTLTGNVTFTDSLADGEAIVLMLNAGASYTVTWPTLTWVTSGGNVAPTLTANDTLVFWKIGSTLYGAYAGSYT